MRLRPEGLGRNSGTVCRVTRFPSTKAVQVGGFFFSKDRMNTDVPLIWTKNGNVPIDSLTYEKDWEVTDQFITFREVWRDDAGDLVKNCVHMYALKGLPSLGAAQAVM